MESVHNGNIFLFDFKRPTHAIQALDIIGDFDKVSFLPHCFSIWRDPSCGMLSSKTKRLFLVSLFTKNMCYTISVV